MAANGLDLAYAYRRKPPYSPSSSSSLLNSFFMSTVNVAANSLVSVASNTKNELSGRKWRPADHLRFMLMITSWVTVWLLRIVMDWSPFSLLSSRRILGGGGGSDGGGGGSRLLEYRPSSPLLLSSSSLSSGSALTHSLSSSSSSSSALASLSKLNLIPYETFDFGGASIKPLGRALSQIFAILNEMPASSGKYQFAMAMAEKIMEENARGGQIELLEVNRTALANGFARTSSLLYESLNQTRRLEERRNAKPWPSRIVGYLPFGSYVTPYLKFVDLAVTAVGAIVPKGGARSVYGQMPEYAGDVAAEKLAQELLWMTHKLREYGAVDEAILQWSFAGGLASASFACNPRVQCCFVKLSATLFRDLARREMEELITSEVKFRMLSIWLPLLCHAQNGLVYPALMRYEKDETERAVNRVIGSLPPMDQEVILTNWFQDYAISASEWPNLQPSYDLWCDSTRELVAWAENQPNRIEF